MTLLKMKILAVSSFSGKSYDIGACSIRLSVIL
jgi:hypothetical protein